MAQIQISIGYGSLGLVFRAVQPEEMPAFFRQTAAAMGYSVEVVEQKLAAGGTLWLNRAEGRKIRGYDAVAYNAVLEQREVNRQKAMAADGYGRDF